MIDDPYADLGGKRETYAEALARSLVAAPKAAMTEQEVAARIVAQRERQRQHDAYFATDYIEGPEATLVSRALAKQLGHFINEPDDRPGGDD